MARVTKGHPRGTRVDGFRSTFEKRIAADLTARDLSFGYEQSTFEYTLPTKKYTPDFEILNNKHDPFHVEAKGWFRSSDRTKLLAVKKANPQLDLRLLFMNAKTRLSKKSKTTYAMWADQHGFPWAERTVPEAWLKQ